MWQVATKWWHATHVAEQHLSPAHWPTLAVFGYLPAAWHAEAINLSRFDVKHLMCAMIEKTDSARKRQRERENKGNDSWLERDKCMPVDKIEVEA